MTKQNNYVTTSTAAVATPDPAPPEVRKGPFFSPAVEERLVVIGRTMLRLIAIQATIMCIALSWEASAPDRERKAKQAAEEKAVEAMVREREVAEDNRKQEQKDIARAECLRLYFEENRCSQRKAVCASIEDDQKVVDTGREVCRALNP